MEITEPVVLDITQGRKKMRLEIASRADGRDLIAAIARGMERLPDDGGESGAVLAADVQPLRKRHAPHIRDGKIATEELRARLGAMEPYDRERLLFHVNGYCPAALLSALESEEVTRPEPGTVVDATIVDDDEDGPVDDEVELHRADVIRVRNVKLASLGKQVARLSEPAAEPVSPEVADRLYDAIVNGTPVIVSGNAANPPHHAVDGERFCTAPGYDDSDRSGYMCTAQDGHDGPDHVAYKPHGGEWHRWPVATAPERPVFEVVHADTRSDSDVLPELQKPCNEAHPRRGTLCTGKIPHPMPHVDEDGETWVTEQQAGAL
jgi:hypothetical protein